MTRDATRQLMMQEIMYLTSDVLLPWARQNRPECLRSDIEDDREPQYKRILAIRTPDIDISLYRCVAETWYRIRIRLLDGGYNFHDSELHIIASTKRPGWLYCDARSLTKKKLYPVKRSLPQGQPKRTRWSFDRLRQIHKIIISMVRERGIRFVSNVNYSDPHTR